MEAWRPVLALRGRHSAGHREVNQDEPNRVEAARDWGGLKAGQPVEGSTLSPQVENSERDRVEGREGRCSGQWKGLKQ